MSSLRVPPAAQIRNAQTPAEQLRVALSQLEAHVGKIEISKKDELVETLLLFDQVSDLMAALSEQGANLAPERARFRTVSEQFRKKGRVVLKRLGGATVLRSLRETHVPAEDQWWWFADDYLREQRAARRKRTLATVALAGIIVAVIAVLYNRFLAPDEATRLRFRYEQRAEYAAIEGNLDLALAHIDQALTYAPEDPELLMFKAVLLQTLDRPEEAETLFTAIRDVYPSPLAFLANRAETYLRVEQPTEALEDAEAMVELEPNSGMGYFLMGSAHASLGNLNEAGTHYQRAGELASLAGDTELEALARVQLAYLTQMMMGPQTATTTPEP